MYRLIIFEGVDKIGKSETVVRIAEQLREQEIKTITPHNDEQEHYIMFDKYHTFVKNIPFFIDKMYVGLMEYYQGFMMVKNVDSDVTILMDRMHFSELAYANYSRKKELLRLFDGKINLLMFFDSFEKSLLNLFDSVHVLCFVAKEGTEFKDDLKNDSLKYAKEQIEKINKKYRDVYQLSKLPKTLIEVEQDGYLYFNTFELANEQIKSIINES